MVNIDVLLDCDWMQSAKLGVSRASIKETFAVRDLFSLGQTFFRRAESAGAKREMRQSRPWLRQITAGRNPAAGKSHEEGLIFLEKSGINPIEGRSTL
jgi:hypothetical protein